MPKVDMVAVALAAWNDHEANMGGLLIGVLLRGVRGIEKQMDAGEGDYCAGGFSFAKAFSRSMETWTG